MALAGEALLFWSSSMVVELTIAADILVRFCEEPKLTRTFGDAYRRDHRHLRRWIPRLTPWRG